MSNKRASGEHRFINQPHRTITGLAIPVTLSLVAEPITGLIDTAFIAQLGTQPLAALGVGTTALSSMFWIFNFLSISSQTEVAKALGAKDRQRAASITTLALVMGLGFSLLVIGLFLPGAALVSRLLGAEGQVQVDAALYLRIRLLGAPAVLLTLIGFGVLRGMQDMRTPLWIAVLVNVLNIVLDAPFIFGFGPLPALGVGGSALATVISQWLGAFLIVRSISRRIGLQWYWDTTDALRLLRVGSDLFIRTGLLTAFLFLTTRVANQIGEEAGAAHQAIRTVWLLTGLFLDGLAITAQSLVGYFVGSDDQTQARRAATYSIGWGLLVGIFLSAAMLLGTPLVVWLLVPSGAVSIFLSAWYVATFTQPLNAMAFVTDGIHWGTSDYTFLRNAMLIATGIACVCVLFIDRQSEQAFLWIWLATGVWIVLRMTLGLLRVWPGPLLHLVGQGQLGKSEGAVMAD